MLEGKRLNNRMVEGSGKVKTCLAAGAAVPRSAACTHTHTLCACVSTYRSIFIMKTDEVRHIGDETLNYKSISRKYYLQHCFFKAIPSSFNMASIVEAQLTK